MDIYWALLDAFWGQLGEFGINWGTHLGCVICAETFGLVSRLDLSGWDIWDGLFELGPLSWNLWMSRLALGWLLWAGLFGRLAILGDPRRPDFLAFLAFLACM